jgi:glycosyltransferase involved in cell wall biosynthesis
VTQAVLYPLAVLVGVLILIRTAVLSLLVSRDARVDIVVVDDGSTDGTAEIVRRLGLPNVRLVCRPNGGKASALNAGVAVARHDLVVMVDADTVVEPDTVRRLVLAPLVDVLALYGLLGSSAPWAVAG